MENIYYRSDDEVYEKLQPITKGCLPTDLEKLAKAEEDFWINQSGISEDLLGSNK